MTTSESNNRTGSDSRRQSGLGKLAFINRLQAKPVTVMLAGSAASGIGDGIVLSAFPLLVAKVSLDPQVITLVFVLQNLPWLVLSLPVGAIVDRHSPKRVMIAADLLRAVDMLLLVLALWLGPPRIALICFVAFVLGVGETFAYAGSTSLLPRIADRQNLAQANGRFVALTSAGEQTIGPALGGILFSVSQSIPFLGNLVSFMLSAALLSQLPATPVSPSWSSKWTPTAIRARAFVGR